MGLAVRSCESRQCPGHVSGGCRVHMCIVGGHGGICVANAGLHNGLRGSARRMHGDPSVPQTMKADVHDGRLSGAHGDDLPCALILFRDAVLVQLDPLTSAWRMDVNATVDDMSLNGDRNLWSISSVRLCHGGKHKSGASLGFYDGQSLM